MKIRIVGYNDLKEVASGLPDGMLELPEDATAGAALAGLSLPESDTALFVNGRAARPDTPLQDGDTLVVFSPIAGG